eukprot:jgi/Orpsp1_1/1186649/evm.model.d7180000052244.1
MEDFNTITWDTGFGYTPTDEDVKNEDDSKIEFEEEHQKFISFNVPSEEKLQIEICDPQKESDGSNFFTTYLIKSKTTLEIYKQKDNQVRHRFNDFINLNQALISAYPSCIIPPLPEKKVI